jgi:Kef-type K+ transport system membrane component KefB
METHDFFLYLLVILLTARVFAELATRLQVPSVIGELFAGVVLGPSLLGWIEPFEAIKLMAEIAYGSKTQSNKNCCHYSRL